MSSNTQTPLLIEPQNDEEQKHLKEDIELKAFLGKASLPQYYHILHQQGIGYDQLKSLTAEELDDICNICEIKIGHKFKLKKAIKSIQQEKMTVLVVGDPGVGKTSFIRKYIQDTFDDNNHEPMVNNYAEHAEQLSDGSLVNITIYDGSAAMDDEKYDAIIICYDRNEQKSFENCVEWRDRINAKNNVIVILLACKSDKFKGYINRQREEMRHKNILNGPGWKAFNAWSLECSAKTGINVTNVFLTAAEQRRTLKLQLKHEELTNVSHSMNVVVIGDSGVGKTSLVHRFLRNEYSDHRTSTVGFVYVSDATKLIELADGSIMEIKIWDTAGQERYQSVCTTIYRRADVILFCYDMSEENSLDSNQIWKQQIEEYGKDNVIVNFVGCKSDAANNEGIQMYVQEIMNQITWKKFNLKNVECSAKTGQNIGNVFLTAAEMMYEFQQKKKAEIRKEISLVRDVGQVDIKKCCTI